jgi:Kef-type K+ transport system membrane component KefB
MSPIVLAASASRQELAELTERAVLIELIAIIAATRLVAWIVKRLGQTEVVGEMLAGILLGPSLLGALAPDLFRRVFDPGIAPIIDGIAKIGLVLLMFQIGLEFESVKSRRERRAIVLVSTLGIVVPFALGVVTATYVHRELIAPRPPALDFALLLGVSMSITALPVLGRIFFETGFTRTRAGVIALRAAVIDDVAGWLLLGSVSLAIAGRFSTSWLISRTVGTVAVVAIAFTVVRPRRGRYFARHLAANGRLKHTGISVALVVVFAFGVATNGLGVHALIGGFLVGVSLHRDERFVAEWKTRVGPLVNTFFLPIFFAFTGLRTDLGGLGGLAGGAICLLLTSVAFAGKYGGAYLGARLAGERGPTAHAIGICMNTRGMMELVVLNVGYDLGVLPRSIFTALVVMALVTTVITTPLIRRYQASAAPDAPVDEPG